jgi:hypothetical protein
MVAGGGGVEGADLLIEAFGEASVGVADNEPDFGHHRSPFTETAGRAHGRGFRAA